MIRNGMRAKRICQRIWNKIKKSLTKCVLDPIVFFEVCYNFLFSNVNENDNNDNDSNSNSNDTDNNTDDYGNNTENK